MPYSDPVAQKSREDDTTYVTEPGEGAELMERVKERLERRLGEDFRVEPETELVDSSDSGTEPVGIRESLWPTAPLVVVVRRQRRLDPEAQDWLACAEALPEDLDPDSRRADRRSAGLKGTRAHCRSPWKPLISPRCDGRLRVPLLAESRTPRSR